MPYAKCPHCGSTFHLRLTEEGSRRWKQEHSQSIAAGQTASLPCFQCWKELRELDVVEVLKRPPEASEVVVGEQGAVVAVLKSLQGEVAYEVEAVAPDGSTKWLHTFVRSQLKAVIPAKEYEAGA
jgi:DNA-directed RNA polymerase subunit RPC12/RpoP